MPEGAPPPPPIAVSPLVSEKAQQEAAQRQVTLNPLTWSYIGERFLSTVTKAFNESVLPIINAKIQEAATWFKPPDWYTQELQSLQGNPQQQAAQRKEQQAPEHHAQAHPQQAPPQQSSQEPRHQAPAPGLPSAPSGTASSPHPPAASSSTSTSSDSGPEHAAKPPPSMVLTASPSARNNSEQPLSRFAQKGMLDMLKGSHGPQEPFTWGR